MLPLTGGKRGRGGDGDGGEGGIGAGMVSGGGGDGGGGDGIATCTAPTEPTLGRPDERSAVSSVPSRAAEVSAAESATGLTFATWNATRIPAV